DGDYSFVAEGGTKPQTDFTWETNYAKPVKAAAWVRLTEESIQDVAGLESVVYDLLAKKHQIKKSKGILYGDGISPNQLPFIFDRFKRFRPEDDMSYGLGLPIVKTIADFHGIKVIAQSTLNEGSTFTLKFPKSGNN
ncbi:MAG TPA: ATP-binding protein, partial [Bacteroidia bacterium]|nr:ATP-binding protein [Bacteroidia bacterium]